MRGSLTSFLAPAIAHAVDRRDPVERRIDRLELAADALDVRRDRAVVDDDARRRASARRDPSRGPGWRASECTIQNSVSVRSTRLSCQCAVRRFTSSRSGPRSTMSSVAGGAASELAAAEQRRDARGEVRQARVLGEVVVGAQAQARDDVEIRVARRQEDDRQRRPTSRAARASARSRRRPRRRARCRPARGRAAACGTRPAPRAGSRTSATS